jgi:hypothetical protein
MSLDTKNDIKNDDLICPITFQIFRDPVIAGDGHAYERAAIVRWIAEHGTSPITRQPLNINELQADDYLRNLADQRRNSSISSNYDGNLYHTDLQRQSSTISYNNNIHVNQPVLVQLQSISNNNIALRDNVENHHVFCNNFYHKHKCWIAIVLTVVLVGAIWIYILCSSTKDSISSGELEHCLTDTSLPGILFLSFLLFLLIYLYF